MLLYIFELFILPTVICHYAIFIQFQSFFRHKKTEKSKLESFNFVKLLHKLFLFLMNIVFLSLSLSLPFIVLPLLLSLRPDPGAACQRSGISRILKMLVKFLFAPTCPGTHGLTSPQSFPMTFTKFSKSPK